MRVKGNISPNVLIIEPYAPKTGHVEVRLRDNINPIFEKDEITGQEIPMFEYDEYTFILPDRDGLYEDIEANLTDWLATGRTLEVSENASIVVAQQRDINAANAQNAQLLETMAAMVEEVYESDLTVFEEG